MKRTSQEKGNFTYSAFCFFFGGDLHVQKGFEFSWTNAQVAYKLGRLRTLMDLQQGW